MRLVGKVGKPKTKYETGPNVQLTASKAAPGIIGMLLARTIDLSRSKR